MGLWDDYAEDETLHRVVDREGHEYGYDPRTILASLI